MTERPALTSTLENPSEFDALVKLRPGEVYFMLLARDRNAPKLVDDWADLNRRKALAEHRDGKIDRAKLELELRQSTQAEMVASDMRAYKAGWDADEASGQRSLSYSGHELPEETERRDALQRQRIKAAAAINNAVAECVTLAEMWPDHPRLYANINSMKNAAKKVRPARPGVGK